MKGIKFSVAEQPLRVRDNFDPETSHVAPALVRRAFDAERENGVLGVFYLSLIKEGQ